MRWLVAAVLGIASAATAASADSDKQVEVMVLGTYHFASPGLDVFNPEVDDVLKPQRQEELEAIAAALARFRPDKILVERVARAADLVDHGYAEFAPTMLETERDERFQIAYRLAHRLEHDTVYAIDEQPGPGEPDYFPFDKLVEWANANGQQEQLGSLMSKGAEAAGRIEALQGRTIAQALAQMNRWDAGDQAFYYEMLTFGDTEQQPGADINAMWYLRNAKIFAKLMRVVQPGDRVVVVYGAGHNYWLRHFAQTAPGYTSVSPVAYLESIATTSDR